MTDPQQSTVFTAVLELLLPHGPWCAYRFLTEPSPLLDGRVPLTLFATGELESIRRAASEHATSPGPRPPEIS